MKTRYFNSILGVVLLILPSCKVTQQDPIEKVRSITTLNEELTITLIKDSTAEQGFCAKSSEIKIRKSFPGNRKVFCREASRTDPDVTQGLTCEDGVEVKAPAGVPSGVKECGMGKTFSLCGVQASQSVVVGTRADGGTLEELTYTGLPWGCRIQLEASLDSTFTKGGNPKLDLLVRPPECPFCPTQNKKTCKSCPELVDTIIKAGQVVKKCTGSACKACPILNGTGTVPHGDGKVYYQKSIAPCGEKCSAKSLLRMCNDGLWEGDSSYAFPQCADTACGCRLPNKPISYNHTTSISVFKTDRPACGAACEKMDLTCNDGKWENGAGSSLKIISEPELSTYPALNCSKNFCACPRPGKDTLAHLQVKKVYSKDEVSCTESCRQFEAALTCNECNLTSPTPGAQDFFDTCRLQNCGCTFTDGMGNTLTIPNGSTRVLSKEVLPACGQACETLTIKCENTVMKKQQGSTWGDLTPGDISTYPTSQSCRRRSCDCSVQSPDGQTFVIPFNQTREFYYPNERETNCDPMACDKNKRKLTCSPVGSTSSQIRTDRGEVGGIWANRCEVVPCGCRVPWGGTIEHGKKFRAFKAENATCAQKLLCDDFKEVTCSNGTLSNYDSLSYRFATCAPAICECRHPALSVDVGRTGKFFKTEKPILGETCEQFSKIFTCLTGGVWQEPGIGEYPFAQCTEPKKDDVVMGGTGGGGGNDEGPGWGFRQRMG